MCKTLNNLAGHYVTYNLSWMYKFQVSSCLVFKGKTKCKRKSKSNLFAMFILMV
jgi:hypothetical protein